MVGLKSIGSNNISASFLQTAHSRTLEFLSLQKGFGPISLSVAIGAPAVVLLSLTV